VVSVPVVVAVVPLLVPVVVSVPVVGVAPLLVVPLPPCTPATPVKGAESFEPELSPGVAPAVVTSSSPMVELWQLPAETSVAVTAMMTDAETRFRRAEREELG
jgi:hypothetical protein